MNHPERFEIYTVPDGMQKISMVKDTKVPNAATFTFLREDHTLANILRMQLLKNPKVVFCGYKVPHPLEHNFVLKLQTTSETRPLEVLRNELDVLISQVSIIKRKFENELTLHGINHDSNNHAMNVDRDF